MSKPSNWYEMDYDQQRVWERQDRAREDAEYERGQAEDDARRKSREASEARQSLESARIAHREDADNMASEIEELRSQVESKDADVAKFRDALERLWNHTPKLDNGRCVVCKVGYANWEYHGLNASPTVGACSDEKCLSHVVTRALAKAGTS